MATLSTKPSHKTPVSATKQAPANSAAADRPKPLSKKDSDLSSSTTIDTERPVIKKLPPIKAPVGLAKGPDLKNCKSKVGSLNNIKHTPTGGGVIIPSQKLKWNAKSKVGSLEYKEHKPGGGELKIESRKLEWKTTSKVQSLQNVKHKPGGGNVKIFNESYAEKLGTKKSTGNSGPTLEDGSNQSSSQARSAPTNVGGANGAKPLTKNMKELNLLD